MWVCKQEGHGTWWLNLEALAEKSPPYWHVSECISLVLCYPGSIESSTSGTEEWLARAGFFSCNMILVFSIIFLVFRNNIHQQTLDSSKLCLSEVCHFHPILHSPPSETLHSEKLDLTEICRFRISDVFSSSPSTSQKTSNKTCAPL